MHYNLKITFVLVLFRVVVDFYENIHILNI